MATFEFEKSDRLKALLPDISDFCQDMQDVHQLLALMTELLNKDDDLDQETIDRVLALWRSVLPLLEQAHSELRSMLANLPT